jgi:hypothetical protein
MMLDEQRLGEQLRDVGQRRHVGRVRRARSRVPQSISKIEGGRHKAIASSLVAVWSG